MTQTWFLTGTSRGLGVEIAKAALRGGDRVVATGRDQQAVRAALGSDTDHLLSLALDVTDAEAATRSVRTALDRFGAIDVLVNNAGYGHLGFFEETTLEDVKTQFATNLFGVLNVTRAALPAMRAARKGRIFNISSLAGVVGSELGSLYCASKFALEGFSESIAQELAAFGIHVCLIEPGPFRTGFLAPTSIRFGAHPVADYDARRTEILKAVTKRNGLQPGDPAKLADAIVRLAAQEKPPLRFPAGKVAVNAIDAKLTALRNEFERCRQAAVDTDGDYEGVFDPRL